MFAGFGRNEIFPKLISYDSDGIIAGKVKHVEKVFVDVDRNGVGAHIEPFAQHEMVERFLDGIDPDFDEYIQTSMSQVLDEFGQQIVNSFIKTSKYNKKIILDAVLSARDEYLSSFVQKAEKRRKENFRQKVLDMVHHMPKSDLASMAESLVNLTSIKRRVSAERETVGGPVDVAIISKGEGFVWIKRKHYFNAELNPRFFINQKTALINWRNENVGSV